MSELLTAAQMRTLEQAAIASGAVTGLELMERAGRGVVDAVFAEWPDLAATSHRAVVLCGPGNNGGDGFVVARLLKDWGWAVEVVLCGDPDKLPPDARVNYERWCALGPVTPYCDTGPLAFWLEPAEWGAQDLIVDALFGIGLTRPVAGVDAFGWTTQMSGWAPDGGRGDYPDARVVAIDLPSGLCADAGRFLRTDPPERDHEDIRAHLTITFHSAKPGHYLAEGPGACGKTVVVDIGLPRDTVPDAARLVGPARAGDLTKADLSHKYSNGHALVLSGGAGRTGAARLAARGALRIGAGLVTLGVPPAAQMEVASQITALMLTRVRDAGELTQVLADARISAVCLGPGLGVDRAQTLVPVVLGAGGGARRPTVLDADALTAFGDTPEALFAMLHDHCVLTPHAGEFARLFPDIAEALPAPASKGPAFSKLDATRAAAARAGCVVLLKGADTVIADPGGACAVNAAVYDRAAPWLATAGSGDVLAGFITGLLARGFAPLHAARTGAWLHADCARQFGPGLIAEDLPEQIPAVMLNLLG